MLKFCKGGVRITKKSIIISAVSGALALSTVGGLVFGGVFTKSDAEKERAVLAANMPMQIEAPNTQGFEFDILCDADASSLFTFEEDATDVLSARVSLRNEHLKAETGALFEVVATEDFYNAAKNDILSGTYKYDLYAASAGNLSRLLAEGELKDISKSEYINLGKDYFDKKTTESLAVGGGKYLVSSAAADARLWSAAIAFTKGFDGGDMLLNTAIDGGFTFDVMYSSGGMLWDDKTAYPLWFGIGESFVSYENDEPNIITHGEFKSSTEKLKKLTTKGADKSDVFELVTVCDAVKNSETVILPLPKANVEDAYGGYIDLSRAVMTAIPKGAANTDVSEYMLSRMAYLSDAYMNSYFTELFGENSEVYKIIKENSSCDLSVLFGYGDIGGLVGEVLRDDTRLSIEYYNRKALYEKALSIVAKRLCIEE